MYFYIRDWNGPQLGANSNHFVFQTLDVVGQILQEGSEPSWTSGLSS